MELVNQTPLAARVDTSEVDPNALRVGVLTAKATYKFDLSGNVQLDADDPLPLLLADEATPFGLLPADIEPRRTELFEVVLLGQAHVTSSDVVESTVVELSVGDLTRQMLVTGDRLWARSGSGPASITRPLPFKVMPLVYERAFGGTQTVWIDETSELDLQDPINPRGRGFDAESAAVALGRELKAPPGFPRIDGYRRFLPNLEQPRQVITQWADVPEPAGWATVPPDCGIYASRYAARERIGAAPEQAPTAAGDIDDWAYRCHPDWLVSIPATAPIIKLTRLIEGCERLSFQLPDERVVADYTIEGRHGSRPLVPHRLVLMPEEKRFSLLYRLTFSFNFIAGDERAFRLRTERGWFPGPTQQAFNDASRPH